MTLKVLEVDSILERSMAIHQGIDKMFALYSNHTTRRQAFFKLLLIKILSQCFFNVLIDQVLNISFTVFFIS